MKTAVAVATCEISKLLLFAKHQAMVAFGIYRPNVSGGIADCFRNQSFDCLVVLGWHESYGASCIACDSPDLFGAD